MSARDGYEPGVPCWVAAVAPDPGAAVAFYTELFGWDAESLMPPGSGGSYHACTLRGRPVAAVVSHDPGPPLPTAEWGTHVWVERADDAAAKAQDAGGRVVIAPFDSPGGGRAAVVADPAGAVFAVLEPGEEHKGAELVNEPGAWSMSMLSTPDPDRARTFYGALFGWETETLDFGGNEVILWRLPGYVGGEPAQPVSREVVGAMTRADAEPPRWDVDFWVHDADATAAKAAELGGEVLEPVHDAVAFRRAVLADPQGARFFVSELILPA